MESVLEKEDDKRCDSCDNKIENLEHLIMNMEMRGGTDGTRKLLYERLEILGGIKWDKMYRIQR